MKKYIILLMIAIVGVYTYSQKIIKDTIYVGNKPTIVGAESLAETEDKIEEFILNDTTLENIIEFVPLSEKNFYIITKENFKETTVIIITKKNIFYEITLIYNNTKQYNTYPLKGTNSQRKKETTKKPIEKNTKDNDTKIKDQKDLMELINISKRKSNDFVKTNKNYLILKLENIINYREQFYFFIYIENTSNIEYEIDKIKSYYIYYGRNKKITDSKEINTITYYKENLESVNLNQNSEIINPGEYKRIIAIIDKNTLLQNESISFNIYENNGQREIELNIPSKIYNDPIYVENIEGKYKISKSITNITKIKENIIHLNYFLSPQNISINFLKTNTRNKIYYQFGLTHFNKNKKTSYYNHNSKEYFYGINIQGGIVFKINNEKNKILIGGLLESGLSEINIENKTSTAFENFAGLSTQYIYSLNKFKIGITINGTYRYSQNYNINPKINVLPKILIGVAL